jgi:hypothetical protein
MRWCGIEPGGQGEPGGTSAASFWSLERRRRRVRAAAVDGDWCGDATEGVGGDGMHEKDQELTTEL